MHRLNREGIVRDDLPIALRDRRQVSWARRIDRCLLCRRDKVNEAGLCVVCYSGLEGEELELALKWTSGIGP